MSDFDLYESEIEELYQKPEEPKVELTIKEAYTALFCAQRDCLHQTRTNGPAANESYELAQILKERISKAGEGI